MFNAHNIIIEVDKENHENYDSDDEKEREDMFKKHNFKIFRCNPDDPYFDLFKFLGEIILYVSELHEEKTENKGINKMINNVTDDFEKIVAVTKIKELKRHVKNTLPKYKANKNWKTI